MTDIYDQHKAAFRHVQAFTAFKLVDGQIRDEIRVAFKFPKNGAGRLYCYVHLIGTRMVRGSASGCGYDKRSAAIMDAVRKLKEDEYTYATQSLELKRLKDALYNCESKGFDSALRDAGYTILNTIS